MLRVQITGDRHWKDSHTIRVVLTKIVESNPGEIAIIHGGAKGVDTLAGDAAMFLELTTWVEPAKWMKYGRGAGPIRNKLMLDRYKPDICIAFHPNLEQSRGTRNMVSLAKQANIPVFIIKDRNDAENFNYVSSKDVRPPNSH